MITPGVDLVERERELALADALLRRATQGDGGAMLAEGRAGIGKTALLTAAASRDAARGMRILRARGGELERDVSFSVVRELFLPAVPSADHVALADAARLALPALGFSADAESPAGSTEGRFAAVYGLYWLAVNLSRAGPLLIVVDDVHAADDDSLRWIAYLVERLEELPVAVLLAARPSDPATIEPSLRALLDDTSGSAIQLEPLSADAVALLAQAHERLSQADDAFAQAVHHATGGVPFLVRAVLDAFAEARVSPSGEAAERVGELAAGAVGHELLARLGRVAGAAIPVAEAIAVLGRAAELHRITALCGQPGGRVAAAADALTTAGFLQPGWPLQFAHALIEESVYRSIPAGRRSDLHGRASELLAADPEGRDQAVAHLLAAQPAGDAARLALLREAARRALASGAPSAAVTYLRRAVREPPPPEQMSETLVELGRAESQSADAAALDHLAQAADLAPGPVERAQALRELSLALLVPGRLPEIIAVSQRALDSLQGRDRELEMEIRAEMLAVAQMDLMPREEFEALVGPIDPDALTAATLAERRLLAALAFDAMRSVQPVERVLDLAHRALSGWNTLGHAELTSPAFILARLALTYAGDFQLATTLTQRALDWTVEHGAPVLYAQNVSVMAQSRLLAGDLAETEACVLGAADAARETIGGMWVAANSVPNLVLAHIERGLLQDARTLMTDFGLVDLPAQQMPFSLALLARGTLRLVEGDPSGALDDALACGRRAVGTGSMNPAAMPWRSLAAAAHANRGDMPAALELAAEELALARQFGAPGPAGIALRAYALIVGGEAAIDALREAVDVLAGSQARLAHGHALVDLGAALRRAGQRRSARDALRSGLELATACGAHALTTQAEDELSASGARLARRPVSGLDALTPSERRVAGLAADGLTNPQIAQSLFLSLKTVEMHLGRAYRKLGITSRGELAGWLRAPAQGAPEPVADST